MFTNLGKQIADLFARAMQSTTLGMGQTVDGPPSRVEEISRTELAEYTLVMVSAITEAVVILAAQVDALTAQLGGTATRPVDSR